MPDEYGHLYEQEERIIYSATRGSPPNYREMTGRECCHNCRYARSGSGSIACEKYIRSASFHLFRGVLYYAGEVFYTVNEDYVCDTWEA